MGPIWSSLKAVVLLHTDTCHMKKTMTKEELLIPFMRIRNPSYSCAVDTQETAQATACPVNQTTLSDPLLAIGNTTSSSPNPTKSSYIKHNLGLNQAA